MLRRTLTVPLDEGVCLADVPADLRLVELEFTLPVARLDVAALMEQNEEWQLQHRYMPQHTMAEPVEDLPDNTQLLGV